jgi:hypothetical protein
VKGEFHRNQRGGRWPAPERLLFPGDDFPGFLGRVGVMEQLSITRADKPVVLQQLPVDQPSPELPADQNNGDAAHLFGLQERQGIEQLIARPKSSRKGDERLGPQ